MCERILQGKVDGRVAGGMRFELLAQALFEARLGCLLYLGTHLGHTENDTPNIYRRTVLEFLAMGRPILASAQVRALRWRVASQLARVAQPKAEPSTRLSNMTAGSRGPKGSRFARFLGNTEGLQEEPCANIGGPCLFQQGTTDSPVRFLTALKWLGLLYVSGVVHGNHAAGGIVQRSSHMPKVIDC